MAGEGLQGEGLGDEVAEGVARVGAFGVGLAEFGGRGTIGVDGPSDLFEVADEFAAIGVDEEM